MDSAVFTIMTIGGAMGLNGDIVYAKDEEFYVIENCGLHCHVLIKEDNPPFDEAVSNIESSPRYLELQAKPLPLFLESGNVLKLVSAEQNHIFVWFLLQLNPLLPITILYMKLSPRCPKSDALQMLTYTYIVCVQKVVHMV